MTTSSSTTRLLSGAQFDLERHTQLFGPLPHVDHSVIASVSNAGLTGRGGAAFPTGKKMDSLRGRRAVVIANGSEGEPLSSKDSVLLDSSPHLVLDGLFVAGAAIEATDRYLVVPPEHAEQLRHAILERRKSGWDSTDVHIVVSTAGFVSGEKSAVIAAAEGRRPIPKYSPTSSSASGLKGRPTLVHNVETLAHIATIARFGVDWFRSSGLAGEPGTMLVTLSGAVNRPGVVEVSIGIPIETLLADIGRTDLRRVRAVLIGGYHGNWLNGDEFAGRSLSSASLAPLGAGPGAGVVHALSVETCGLRATSDIVRYLAGESTRQCGPCFNVLPRLAEAFHELAYGKAAEQTCNEIRRYAGLVEGRGACHHPDGTARLVRSALTAFVHDVELHRTGHCEAATSRVRSQR